MENINSYNDAISNANLIRNANFSTLQETADRFIDKEKEIREKIEESTLPFEVPVLEHTLGELGKKALVKAGLRSADDEDTITRSLAKKGLNTVLEKLGVKKSEADAAAAEGEEVVPIPAPRPPVPAPRPQPVQPQAPQQPPQPAPRPTPAQESDQIKQLRRLKQEAEARRDQRQGLKDHSGFLTRR